MKAAYETGVHGEEIAERFLVSKGMRCLEKTEFRGSNDNVACMPTERPRRKTSRAEMVPDLIRSVDELRLRYQHIGLELPVDRKRGSGAANLFDEMVLVRHDRDLRFGREGNQPRTDGTPVLDRAFIPEEQHRSHHPSR